MDLTARYIPGRRNIIADQLSRTDQIVGTEWSLNQDVVNSLAEVLKDSTLGVYTVAQNVKLPLYCSLVPDLGH